MIRASQILFWFGLSIAASLALYHTSDRVHELDRQLRDIDAATEGEQQTIHVLKAEWAYLSSPARVETEARRHLAAWRPTATSQVMALDDLGDVLPTREEAMASVTVTSTPIATIKASLAVPPPVQPVRANVRKTAAADKGYINDHMVIQRTASAQPVDQIGALIGGLGSHP